MVGLGKGSRGERKKEGKEIQDGEKDKSSRLKNKLTKSLTLLPQDALANHKGFIPEENWFLTGCNINSHLDRNNNKIE